jgi:RNA polymerase sigma-70 factor (ECF subfamily)
MLLSDAFVDLLAERIDESSEDLQSVMATLGPCVEKLKTPERQLIRNHYVLGETVKVAAAQLGMSAEAAYKSLQRIRRKLFDCVRRVIHQEELP